MHNVRWILFYGIFIRDWSQNRFIHRIKIIRKSKIEYSNELNII